MAIEFRFDPENKCIFICEPEKELSLTSDEETLLETVCLFIADHVDVSMLGIDANIAPRAITTIQESTLMSELRQRQ